ncbi:MAG: hypothetical protein IJ471_01825 [Eubacterium sp.]|nr:hypothetical protein [Eubacterium sp.]
MGKFSILLCDSDEVYAKRLATGLQKQFRESVSVKMCTDVVDREGQAMGANLLLSSKLPRESWRQAHPDCICVLLEEGEGKAPEVGTEYAPSPELLQEDRLADVWQGSIFKYQSVSRIARLLQNFLPTAATPGTGTGVGFQQLWYGVLSPVRHESTIPFACTLAGLLGEEKRVLLVVLMEFSGVVPLLELEAGQEMETLLLRLRQKERLERIPFPMVHVLPDFDLLHGPDNPMVLYELNEQDVTRLLEHIQRNRKYDAVVWVAGNMIRGIGELFSRSEKVFSLEKTDAYSMCCQREFDNFFKKLLQEGVDRPVSVRLPAYAGEQTGEHLLWQWKHSGIGQVIKRHLKGESVDGTMDGVVTKKDFRTVGREWRDFRSDADGADRWTD